MAMTRTDCLRVLAENRTDELVLTAWQSTDIWERLSPSKYNFPSVRTMGECSTFALGVSLARPDKRVLVLEGDGSLCMNLGSLITIATAAPANFRQFILHNKMYETTGGQTLPNVDHLDLATIARGAGISKVHRYGDLATFDREIRGLLKEQGPVFVVLDVVSDASHVSGQQFGKVRARDKEFNKQFREALKE